MTPPSLPDDLDDLYLNQQRREKELYRSRLVHYHYVNNVKEYNKFYYTALMDPMGTLRRRLFTYASHPWEGETLELKVALIEAMKKWDALTGQSPPCPIMFDAEDINETMKLDAKRELMDADLEWCERIFGLRMGSWVRTDRYEEVLARAKHLKKDMLSAAEFEEERAQIAAHWFLDDMDESKYN